MAIDPSFEYPGQIDTTDPTGYPRGKAQNVITPGDGTGTPFEERLVNDIFGFQQALLGAVGVTPSGTPDAADASQYLDALRQLFSPRGLQHFSLTKDPEFKALSYAGIEGVAYHPTGGLSGRPGIIAVGGSGIPGAAVSMLGDHWQIEAALTISVPNDVAADVDTASSPTWVVVGNTQAIQTSTDGGASWTSRTSAIASGNLEAVRWGNGLFVCLGNTDEIQTSPDGITWTIRANPTTEQLEDLYFADGKWVLVGGNGAVITSTDGLSWVDRSANSAATSLLQTVTYDAAAGLWVSAGNGELQTTPNPDTTPWTDRSAAFGFSGSQLIPDLHYNGDGVLMALRRFGVGADLIDAIGISFNGGVTWDVREYDWGLPSGDLRKAHWVEGRWFVFGDDPGGDAMILKSLRS